MSDSRTWLGVEPTHNPFRWVLPIDLGVCSGYGTLFGGAALGAAIVALEGTAGRPVVWATAHYLSFAPEGSVLDIDVVLAAEGNTTTQARATGHIGGSEIITVNAALGRRDYPDTYLHPVMPPVRPPEECPLRAATTTPGTISSRFESRMALLQAESAELAANDAAGLERRPGLIGPGRVGMWIRVPGLTDGSAAALAVLGDFVPMAISVALDAPTASNSLDNTIRVLNVQPTEWFLLDIQVEGVVTGFGHGMVRMFTPDGVLLAIGSQSAMVRKRT
ncbi:MAG: thioesterase family protein [Acidimicrobiales bacterium]|nr:thioesterase family protein [Acidimicrobiales bacterium]